MSDFTDPSSWLSQPTFLNRVPRYMHDGLKNYVVHGILPGSFLTAVLENKLVDSFAQADDINRENMYSWANFLYNAMPAGSWGSEEAVRKWSKSGGLAGMLKEKNENGS